MTFSSNPNGSLPGGPSSPGGDERGQGYGRAIRSRADIQGILAQTRRKVDTGSPLATGNRSIPNRATSSKDTRATRNSRRAMRAPRHLPAPQVMLAPPGRQRSNAIGCS